MKNGTGEFAGIPVTCATLSGAVEELLARAAMRSDPASYRLVNSYTIALADRMRLYHHLLCERGINLPDGRPLVRVLNNQVQGAGRFHQVRGPSLFVECLDRGRDRQTRHFFLGGTQDLLDALVAEVGRVFPGAQVCGTYSPPFRELSPDERNEQDRLIAAADPDIVWVGLGTPKQDFEAQRITDRLKVSTAGVGAAFAFMAGTQREAPQWVRGMSLEWLFRLWSEPRRLWRRYLFGNLGFLYLVLRTWRRPQPHTNLSDPNDH